MDGSRRPWLVVGPLRAGGHDGPTTPHRPHHRRPSQSFGLVHRGASSPPSQVTDKHRSSPSFHHHLTISPSSHHLRSLTSIGARPTGSYENEVLAVQLLQRSLAGIKERAQPIHKLTVELQKPRGSFNLKFVDGLTHSYRCSELQI